MNFTCEDVCFFKESLLKVCAPLSKKYLSRATLLYCAFQELPRIPIDLISFTTSILKVPSSAGQRVGKPWSDCGRVILARDLCEKIVMHLSWSIGKARSSCRCLH